MTFSSKPLILSTPMHRRDFLQRSLATVVASTVPRLTPAAELASALPRSVSADGIPSLRDIATPKGLFFGSAVSDPQLHRPDLAALLLQQCSILVPENSMKWRLTHPEPDRFDFSQADNFMAFAESNHLVARGHNLCWHEHNPAWVDSTVTSQNAANIFTNHILTVAARYRGRIHSWDVVNEGIRPAHHNHHDLTTSIWLKTIGEDYIYLAYRTAADADPNALLTYNDFDIETDQPEQEKKREAILALFHRMKKRSVPIHALGVQAHLRTYAGMPTWNGLNKFLKQIEKLNLQVYVTELDVDDSSLPADVPERDRLVAEYYKSFLTNILQHNSVKAVLTWCLSDRDSWLQGFRPRPDHLPQRPLPFDAELNPKSTFFSLRDSLSSK